MKLYRNPAQEEAVNTLKGPVMIISCPGSGKTTTLVRRIHRLIESGVPAHRILMVTFTRDAAKGMAEKYNSMFSKNMGVTFATIHSLCFNILKNEGIVKNEDVLSERKKLEFISGYLRSRGFYKDAWDMAVAAATAISACKNNYRNPQEMSVQGISAENMALIYKAYEEWKSAEGFIDFDDMLILCLETLKKNAGILSRYRERFEYIQCDEYQDTNYIQRDILYCLSADNHNLCIVGDDDQSIYGFRGAKPEIMFSFKKDFPDAKIIRMGMNYRSGSKVVDMADRLIKHNKRRFKKELISYRGEEGFEGNVRIRKSENRKDEIADIADAIWSAHEKGVPYSEMAILFRNNTQAQRPVEALSQKKIPYYCAEAVKCMYESFVFDDLKKYVKLGCGLGSRYDLLDVLNHPNRYFKVEFFRNVPYTYDGFIAAAQRNTEGREEWKAEKAQEAIDAWFAAFGPGTVKMTDSPKEIFNRLDRINYKDYIHEYAQFRNLEPDELMSLYNDLKNDASGYATLTEWYDAADEYTVKIHEEMSRKDTDGVFVATMHRAKGLEWQNVWIIDADEKICPHKKSATPAAIEEERRLFYVAMTRAKDELSIWSVGKPSRFIDEFRKRSIRAAISPVSLVVEPNEVPKMPPGHGLKHKKFGYGTIVRYENDRIVVSFPDMGEKTFLFPETFCRGILKYT